MIRHSMAYLDLRHDFFRVCVFIAANALLANFLPRASRLKRWPKLMSAYAIFVDIVAGFALNWRVRLPCLCIEFLGFRVRRSAKGEGVSNGN